MKWSPLKVMRALLHQRFFEIDLMSHSSAFGTIVEDALELISEIVCDTYRPVIAFLQGAAFLHTSSTAPRKNSAIDITLQRFTELYNLQGEKCRPGQPIVEAVIAPK
jgi:hypothetical protein